VIGFVHVRCAREHNLKNIDLDIPRDALVVFTTISSLLRMLYSRAGDYPPNQPILYAESFSPCAVQRWDVYFREASRRRVFEP
jgi:excinuclease UvrABC ATPase subunit